MNDTFSEINIKGNLDQLPGHSRVWIFQSDRILTDSETELADRMLSSFTAEWKAHGNKLSAGYGIFHNTFLVLAVDEQAEQASGCSIDKSFHVIRDFGQAAGVDLFNRLKLYYLGGEGLQAATVGRLKELLEAGQISVSTPVFDNMVASLEDLRLHWPRPLGESWAAVRLGL